jgi:hypothetical protein
MKSVSAVALAVLTSCGVADAPDFCRGSSAKYYDEGLAYQLKRANVPHRAVDGGVCVDRKYASQMKEAERQLENAFNQIATNPGNACEERALVEWAEREGLRYELAPALNSRNEPSGNLFLIRSFAYEEMVTNREKFDRSAPKGTKCKS